jgi:hypothetical protein
LPVVFQPRPQQPKKTQQTLGVLVIRAQAVFFGQKLSQITKVNKIFDRHYNFPNIVGALGKLEVSLVLSPFIASGFSAMRLIILPSCPGPVNLDSVYNTLPISHASGHTVYGDSTTAFNSATERPLQKT